MPLRERPFAVGVQNEGKIQKAIRLSEDEPSRRDLLDALAFGGLLLAELNHLFVNAAQDSVDELAARGASVRFREFDRLVDGDLRGDIIGKFQFKNPNA